MAKIKKPLGYGYNPLRHKPKRVNARSFRSVYWPYLPAVLFISASIVIAGLSGGASRPFAGKVLGYATDLSRPSLLQDSNTERTNENLADLQLNDKLDKAAQAKAQDMVNKDYWSHQTPSGQLPWAFVDNAHYKYRKVGENLAAGFDSANAVIRAWLASPTHRQNMLDPSYTDVGFGYANSPNYAAAGGGQMTVIVAFYGQKSTDSSTVPLASTNNPPATNLSPIIDANLASSTSRIQLAFARSPFVQVFASAAVVALLASIGLWLGRHFYGFHKAWRDSERFVIRHPRLDIILLSIAVLSFVLSQTVGYIQ